MLFIGLDASGRTTALYRLKLGEIVTTIPTIGFNVETVDYGDTSFTIWDVGGCDRIRPLWRHYYQSTQAVIYCVDSNDRERMTPQPGDDETSYMYKYGSARNLFMQTLDEDELKNAVVLVLANKQDLPGACSVEEVAQAMGVEGYRQRGVSIVCMGSCATSGDGLLDALDWLSSAIKAKRAHDAAFPPPPPPPPSSSSTTTNPLSDAAMPSSGTGRELTPEELAAKKMEDTMEEWLSREDDEDEVFIRKLVDATLDDWDHR